MGLLSMARKSLYNAWHEQGHKSQGKKNVGGMN